MSFDKIIDFIYMNTGPLVLGCLVLSILLGLFNFRKLGLPIQRFLYFLLFNLAIEILARAIAYSGGNNLPLLHFYTLGEFILLSFFYQSLNRKFRKREKLFWQFVVGGVIFILINSWFIQSIYQFNTIAKTFVQLCIISYAVIYFYDLTENASFTPRIEKSLRLINSAVIIYYSGSLFIFMCSQISFDTSQLYKLFWAFNVVLNLIFQILVLWGIWKVVFRRTTLSS